MTSDLKAATRAVVDKQAEDLVALSERIHAHPETAWQEHQACAWVGKSLSDVGFNVEERYLGLETAFRATHGSGPVRIGLFAEYDALPGLGHACGHNLIAAMSVGAACGAGKRGRPSRYHG